MLSIAVGSVYFTTQKRGNDIIVSVGNGKITLVGAANLSKVNIVETSVNINNRTSNILINGTFGNDTIYNYGNNVTINALADNDSINNKAANVSIDGGDGSDNISNTGNNVTIAPQSGNDKIRNDSVQVSIYGGAGNDSIFNNGSKVTIAGGDGADTIENYTNSDEVSIAGDSGNDSIKNSGNNVTISGGEGSDTIKLDMNSNEIFIRHDMGDGNDRIEGFNSTSTLQIGDGTNTYSKTTVGNDIIIADEGGEKITLAGAATLSTVHISGVTTLNVDNSKSEVSIIGDRLNDNVTNSGKQVTIATYAGADTVFNYAQNVIIDASADKDSIANNNANYTSILGGDGDDFIDNRAGFRNTISGGAGNDDIYIVSSNEALIQYNEGDDNDYVTGFSETSTLQIGDGTGSYYKEIRGDDVIITVDKSKITLTGAGTLSTVNIFGEEEIEGKNVRNKTDNSPVSGTEGDDSIRNNGSEVTIQALGGNDSIQNYNDRVSIDGGAGKDSIDNKASDVSISGGAGDDSIYNDGGDNVTIAGGTGNDTIELDYGENYGENVLIKYNESDGNDIICGFNETSTLSIAGGLYSLQTSDKDVIVSVNDEKITLAGASTLSTVNIIGVEDKTASKIDNSNSDSLIFGGNANDSIKNSGQNVTILGYGGNDSIYNNGASVLVDASNGDDTVSNTKDYVTIAGGAGKDSIDNKNSYTSISGGEGNDTLRNEGNNVTLYGGIDNDSIDNKASNVLFTYSAGDGNDVINGFNENSTLSIAGDYYSSEKSGNDIIIAVGNNKITLQGAATLKTVNIVGENKENAVIIANEESYVSINGTEGDDTISNTGEAATINALGGDDSISNSKDGSEVSIDAGAGNDTISNKNAQDVTITAGAGKDSIYNQANFSTIDGGADNDSIINDFGFYSSISGAEGNDVISVASSSDATINGGTGNDTIKLEGSDEALIEYTAGDGNDLIQGFDETSTLAISGSYSTAISGKDVIVNVGNGKITLEGATSLSEVNIISTENNADNTVNLTVKNSEVTSDTSTIKNSQLSQSSFGAVEDSSVKASWTFNKKFSLLNINSALENNPIRVTNAEDSFIRANGSFGTAILSSSNVLEYQENNVALTSENYDDKITFAKDTTFNYGEIQVELLAGSVISTKGAKEISFDNNSSAKITAPEGAKINIDAGTFTVNNLPVNSTNGAGTITVEKDGLNFEGYGVQFVDLEVARESYFERLTPMVVEYNSSDKSYAIHNTACVKTLSNDFAKITFAFGDDTKNYSVDDEKYAYYKVNDKEFLVANDADNINVVEADGNLFKIQGKEVDAEKIGRVTIDEQITFSGTEINFDGVQVNYAQNKQVIYSLDGKEISISDAATIGTRNEEQGTSSDEKLVPSSQFLVPKTFKCEAGSYVVNGRSFETSTDLTFSADANQIKIPLSDATTKIYFDGVEVGVPFNGTVDGEIVFDLADDKIFIPNGAELNVTSPEEIKLNITAGNVTVDYKKISSDTALEITVDKDNIKVPLSENPVTINNAAIVGSGDITIDNTNAIFFSILLPDGALVKNVSGNTFELTGKNSSAYFGDANKKVQLTQDGTAFIEYSEENAINVGANTLRLENVAIGGNDAWTVETSGTDGIDKVTGITDGATLSTSTDEELHFEVETDGAGEFTICGEKFTSTDVDKNIYVVYGNSDGEIKVAPQGEEYADDDSEPAGTPYQFDKAGNYTVNGITFHATENSKVQTITRGIEFDLSTGTFQYDGLTLEGSGAAQINRYNADLISLTDGAKVSGDNCYNRQFEFEGEVELIGKKFETDEQIRCALIDIHETIELSIDGNSVEIPFSINGFVVEDKYVEIQNDCYDSVKIVDKKVANIEGVKASAQISGTGLSNVSILTKESGEFTIRGRLYKISGDSDGVTFVTDSHGNVSEINGLTGSVEGDFENEVSVNGKAVRLTGASSVKVVSDGENITEIANVAGDSVTTDGNTYRKNVRVYELGGAEKLTTSADGAVIFNGNKFETSAGKTFTLDDSGNVLEIGKAQVESALLSANVTETDEENFATINLSTTDGLEKVFGNFSEGLTVNGVFVRVTDSTNFVVKDDDENIYIETTAADTFTIKGKTFKTSTDKTIFKLDADGNVCEIVTDSFFPDKKAYTIAGDFNDEIIFNGKKFCVTGTNDTGIFLANKPLISVDLARNAVEVIESNGAAEIVVSGEGKVTVGDKTFDTSNDFLGFLQMNSDGVVYSSDYFVGTISGELGGLELKGITIDSEDSFSVTSDGSKITAIDNLKNGSFTCDNLDGMTINGAEVFAANSEEVMLTVTDGELKISELTDSASVANFGGKVNFVTKTSGEFFIGEDNFKITDDDSVTFVADENGKVQQILDLDEKESSTEEILESLGIDNSDEAVIVNAENKNVTLSGGDLAVVEDTSAKVSITAGKGNDTIVSQGENVFVSLRGGKTDIFATGGKMTLEGYNASTGSSFHTDYEDIFAAVDNGSIYFNKGRLTIGEAVIIIDEDGNNLVNFFNAAGELQKVGGAPQDESLNLSKEKADLVLYADVYSTLVSGNGNDSIFAFAGSQVDAGAGNNYIEIEAANDDDATINVISGKNTIVGFNAGFDDSSDVIENSSKYWDNKFDGTNIIIKTDGGKAVISNVGSGEEFVKFKQSANGYGYKVALAQKNSVITVDSDDLANVYSGEKSGVDFTGFDESLLVNLNENAEGKAVGESIYFYGINQVTVGSGFNTLISSSRNETLTGSDGTTEFIFDAHGGRDVIQNFNFAEDKINVANETITAVVLNNAGGVRLQISDDAWLTLNDAQGKNFKINNFVAKVNRNIEYDDTANYFMATSKNATMTVGEEAEIWLDGSHGKTFVGDIRTLDASNSDGSNTLAGNDSDNIILAGKGDASLWGGNGGDDLLTGGSGKNTFFYCAGNGNDTITGANDGDAIILSTVTLDQISSTSIAADSVSIDFKDGGSLQINSAADVTYQLADGSKFSANHGLAAWITNPL